MQMIPEVVPWWPGSGTKLRVSQIDRPQTLTYNAGMSYGEEKAKRIIRLMAEQLGVTEEKVRVRLAKQGFSAFAADSLDVVELVIDLEDEMNSDGDNE